MVFRYKLPMSWKTWQTRLRQSDSTRRRCMDYNEAIQICLEPGHHHPDGVASCERKIAGVMKVSATTRMRDPS
jgi:hypothetical protein